MFVAVIALKLLFVGKSVVIRTFSVPYTDNKLQIEVPRSSYELWRSQAVKTGRSLSARQVSLVSGHLMCATGDHTSFSKLANNIRQMF